MQGPDNQDVQDADGWSKWRAETLPEEDGPATRDEWAQGCCMKACRWTGQNCRVWWYDIKKKSSQINSSFFVSGF